jgi:hypothetical protein
VSSVVKIRYGVCFRRRWYHLSVRAAQHEREARSSSGNRRNFHRIALTWGSLALAAAESICLAVVGLSGVRVAIGLTSLIAAAGPATGWHRDAIRIPLLAIGTAGALLSLLLLWNERQLRGNPSAAWRVQPYSKSQKRQRLLQFWLAIITLALVAGEWITHPWFHRG